jgi:hypothetical protein
MPSGRRSAAQRSEDDRTVPPLRRLCGRRDTKRSDWRDGRDAAGSSRLWCCEFSGPASGVAGGWGDDLACAAPSGAQRSDLQAGQFVEWGRRSRTREGDQAPRSPATGRAAQRARWPRRPNRIASAMAARQGRDDVRLTSARRAAQQRGRAKRGDALIDCLGTRVHLPASSTYEPPGLQHQTHADRSIHTLWRPHTLLVLPLLHWHALRRICCGMRPHRSLPCSIQSPPRLRKLGT